MRIIVLLLLTFIVCVSCKKIQIQNHASTQNSKLDIEDIIMLDLTNNLYQGILRGYEIGTDDSRYNYTLGECNNDSEGFILFDGVMRGWFMSNVTNQDIINGLQGLVQVVQKFMVPTLEECSVPNDVINNILNATAELLSFETLFYENATLIINGVNVYDNFARVLSEWSKSDMDRSGYYFGVVLSIVQTGVSTNAQSSCGYQAQGNELFWEWYRSALARVVPLESDEIFILSPYGDQAWLWGGNRENNTYNYEQYMTLDSTVSYTKGFLPDNYFDQWYNSFLGQIDAFNTTEDNEVKELDVLFRQAIHRSQLDMDELLPLFYHYANTTQNPVNLTDWINNICKAPPCINYINDVNESIKIENEIEYVYANSLASEWERAFNNFQNASYYFSYTEDDGLPPQKLPSFDTSLLSQEYLENYQNGNYAGLFYFETTSDIVYRDSCQNDLGAQDLPPNILKKFQQTPLFQVNKNGTWHDIEFDYEKSNYTFTASMKGLTRVNVTVGNWFDEHILWRSRNISGYSGLDFFGPDGVLNSMITGFVVGIDTQVYGSAYLGSKQELTEDFGGPIVYNNTRVSFFNAGYSWSMDGGYESFHFSSTGQPDTPYILGYINKKLPFPTPPTY
eukprot:TRINITY_DN5117_c0_g2_i2.p1 TRINITY_DN5117_c0_g2~~TRINITY_DN5117_c0_g2_i2.p1  ORF type:complete len:621 (-),score=124.33 TRINITY_DN5117_c0_g2_i2:124-1986(-)